MGELKIYSEAEFQQHRQEGRLQGVYKNVNNKHYHSVETHVSRSSLMLLAEKSPKYFKYIRSQPVKETVDMKLGTWAHTMVLEPETMSTVFYNEQDIVDEVMRDKPETKSPRSTKLYKQLYAQVASQGYEIIQEKHVRVLQGITNSVGSSDMFKALTLKGIPELSCFGLIEGVPVKARLDWINLKLKSGKYIIDFKTTREGGRAFLRACYDMNYDAQAAFYMDVFKAATGISIDGYGIVAAEKEPPYCVSYHGMTGEFLAIGRNKYMKALQLYDKCTRENNWPDYPQRFEPLVPEIWMYKNNELEDF